MTSPKLSSETESLIALLLKKGIGPVIAKSLLQQFGSAINVFESTDSELLKIDGIGPVHVAALRNHSSTNQIWSEIQFCERNNIDIIPFYSERYPVRLKQLVDSPLLLFSSGNFETNPPKTIGIVGTRRPSARGIEITKQIVSQLKDAGVQIISGLAYGIDFEAHQSALNNGISTVGVLAHGLDMLYPRQHFNLSKQMKLHSGGTLTEMPTKTTLHPDLFPRRNRIVAGMVDALLVIESGLTGGSMATAQIAYSYDREVLVIPGQPFDPMSKGCNAMIKRNVAHLVEDATDILQIMKWNNKNESNLKKQLDLFPSLNDDEKLIMNLLSEKRLHIDQILDFSGLPLHRLTLSILELELKGLVLTLPGKLYQRVLQ